MNVLEPAQLSDGGLGELIALLRGELDEVRGDVVRQTEILVAHNRACRERDQRRIRSRPISLKPDESYNPPSVGDILPSVLDMWTSKFERASRN